MRDVIKLEKAARLEEERRVFEERQLLLDAYNVMVSEEGQRLLAWLLRRTGVDRSSFSTNALTMAFHEGERNVGLDLQRVLKKSSEELFLTIKTKLEEQSGDYSKQPA